MTNYLNSAQPMPTVSLFKGRTPRYGDKDTYGPNVGFISEKWAKKGGRIEVAYAGGKNTFEFESNSEKRDQLRNAQLFAQTLLDTKRISYVVDSASGGPSASAQPCLFKDGFHMKDILAHSPKRQMYLAAVSRAAYNARQEATFPKFNTHDIVNNFDAYLAYELGWHQDDSQEEIAALVAQADQLRGVSGPDAQMPAHINKLRAIEAVVKASPWAAHAQQPDELDDGAETAESAPAPETPQ